jgi:pimeloyl-ACP methyl ester carboxylesterase
LARNLPSPDYKIAFACSADRSLPGWKTTFHQQESKHKLKPDNEARIVWANDSLKQKTEYVIVYLHGFSASQEEGNPVHRRIAAQFGCNLYLSRLSEHGIDTTDALFNMTAESLWESAKEALCHRQATWPYKVILMGTSTGGTLALAACGSGLS